MAGLGSLDAQQKIHLRQAVIELLNEATFINAITYSTNSTRQVRARFGMMDAVIADLRRAEI
jgi:hypothetical protein